MEAIIATQLKEIFQSEIAHFLQQLSSMYKQKDEVEETINQSCMA